MLGRHVVLTLEPFRALGATEQQALEQAVQRYSQLVGKPIMLA
jgi:hypothetical protein